MGVVSSFPKPAVKAEDPAAISRQTQNMSGITCSTAEGRLITLTQLREYLKLSIAEARKAQKDERFWGRMLAGAKAAQATSNVILDVFGAFDDRVALIGSASKFGQAVVGKDIYGAATAAVDVGFDGKKLSGPGGAAKEAFEQAAISKDAIKKRADIINATAKGQLNTSKAAQYGADSALEIGELSAKHMKADKVANIIKAARAVNQYAFEVASIVTEFNESERGTEKDSGAIMTALNQLASIEKKIGEIQTLADGCEVPQIEMMLK
jgi:hypothetical protein